MHTLNIDPWFVNKAKQTRDGRLNAYDTLEARKTALVVVDMQNYFVADGMPACAPEARTIVPHINRLARALRTAGGTVIWIQTEARIADPPDWANRQEAMSAAGWAQRQALLAQSGEGFPLYPPCEVLPEDKIAIKYRYSAFIPYPSELDGLLRTHSIDTLLITGVATSTCCESTARDAAMWGYRTIMVADGNADQTDALHNHTLGKFLGTFGDVQATDEVLAKLGCAEKTHSRHPQPAGLAARL
jgi:ureidoacrylate peracid hydrolase